MQATLRPATGADIDFCIAVYASTRADELASVGWDAGQAEAFVRQQFAAQAHHYRNHFPGAVTSIIGVDGQDAGRLIVDRSGDGDIGLLDIALLPPWRGQGLGSSLIGSLLHEAAAADRGIRIHVECNNPALNLYRRLGFVEVERFGIYHRMRWQSTLACAA